MAFIFHFIYGMSSFPLTNSYFSRWLKPPTNETKVAGGDDSFDSRGWQQLDWWGTAHWRGVNSDPGIGLCGFQSWHTSEKVAVEHPKQPIWKLPFSVPALKDWCVLEATPLAIVVFQESSSTQIAWPRGVQHYHIESEWFFEVFWCVFWPVWLPWPTDESLLPVFYHDETACWFTHSPLESLIMTYVRRLRRLILLWYQICKNKIPKFICLS